MLWKGHIKNITSTKTNNFLVIRIDNYKNNTLVVSFTH
jgi:hypothetical protein